MTKQNLNYNFFKSAKKTFAKEINSLSKIPFDLDQNIYNKFCKEILSKKGNLFLMGMGKSGNIAEKISSTLSSTGTPSIYINAAEASHGDLGALTKKDILVIFSFSGETEEILKILPSCKKKVKSILSVTGNKNSSLSKNSKLSITLNIDKEACPMDLAPTTSSTSMLVLGDALAISLLEANNFSPKDFAENHPGGSLGKKFFKVKDLMIKAKDIPILSGRTKINKAIYPISSKGLGLTLIKKNNKVVGIFTDGDLRRSIERKIDTNIISLSEVMTKNFKWLEENELITKAISNMEKNKIFSLLVKNKKGKIVGLIRMHEILEAKII
ncbi:KpsF/GutQ family sugar-phosphate isomerase [SAR86 cluster bacterium]|nr:KpsF/GutQ family sugar-phosphate isomerase [SAR86 cluster bacterium]|tara:strand:+ start:172 stop:1152 length:981 start_codon:yes stop_codon:yes gene_type:complete